MKKLAILLIFVCANYSHAGVFESLVNPFIVGSTGRLSPGDHLVIRQGAITHHGIYVGDGEVVDFTTRIDPKTGKQYDGVPRSPHGGRYEIRRVSIQKFKEAGSGGIKILRPTWCWDNNRKIIVKRALSQVGRRPSYLVVGRNCQDFADWCKRGRRQTF